MNALRIIAFLTFGLTVAHSKRGTKPNHRIASKVIKAQEENDCEYFKDACEAAVGCEWDNDGEGGLCGTADGTTWTPCCIEVSTTTTTTTPAPTPAPTCLSTSDRRWACASLDEECCYEAESCIWYEDTDSCETTSAPTTAEPTTDAPTTAQPTTAAPTTADPTSAAPTTAEPTTDAPTTSEPTTDAPTTAEPTTDAPTTPSPTTSEPTKRPTTDAPTTANPTTADPTSAAPTTDAPTTPSPTTPSPTTVETTETVEIPTPNPTMHSAAKWEMLHPNYKGGDGELMWQVYYGDFSDDARFDDFRKEQLWDADVIRPIIDEDAKFERYQAVAVEAHSSSTSQYSIAQYSAYLWALFATLAVMSALVFWCRRSRNGGYAKLVDTETALLLDSTRKQNEVYSN